MGCPLVPLWRKCIFSSSFSSGSGILRLYPLLVHWGKQQLAPGIVQTFKMPSPRHQQPSSRSLFMADLYIALLSDSWLELPVQTTEVKYHTYIGDDSMIWGRWRNGFLKMREIVIDVVCIPIQTLLTVVTGSGCFAAWRQAPFDTDKNTTSHNRALNH